MLSSGLSFPPFFELEVCLAERNDVTISEDLFLDSVGIDEYAILAPPIDDSGAVVVGYNYRMASTNECCLQLNVIMSSTSNG